MYAECKMDCFQSSTFILCVVFLYVACTAASNDVCVGGTMHVCFHFNMYMYMYVYLTHMSVLHIMLRTVPASRNEYQTIRLQLESETFPGERPGDKPRSFHSLSPQEQAQLEKKRLAGEKLFVCIVFIACW